MSRPSAIFLRRRAELYRAVNNLLTDENQQPEEIIFGLTYLQMADYTIGGCDIQRMHLRAIDSLLFKSGGMLSSSFKWSRIYWPTIIATQYFYVDLEIPNLEQVESAKVRFLSCLERIQHWRKSTGSSVESTSNNKEPAKEEPSSEKSVSLDILRRYLTSLVCVWEDNPATPYAHAAGIFYLLQSLCITQVHRVQDYAGAFRLLQLLQNYLEGSAQINPVNGELELYPGSAAGMFSYISLNIWDGSNGNNALEAEIRTCAACIDGMKIFPYFSRETRLRLSRAYFSLAFGGSDVNQIDEGFLADLNLEITSSWWAKTLIGLQAGLATPNPQS